MLDGVQFPTVNADFFASVNQGLTSLEESAMAGRRAGENENELTFLLDHFEPEVRVQLDAGVNIVNRLLEEGYLRIDGTHLAVGPTPFPLPPEGISVQFHTSQNEAMCRTLALEVFFGLAAVFVALALIAIGMSIASIPGGQVAGGWIIFAGILVALGGFIYAMYKVNNLKKFCGDAWLPRTLSWTPGSAPVLEKTTGDWAE